MPEPVRLLAPSKRGTPFTEGGPVQGDARRRAWRGKITSRHQLIDRK